jgi:hypothetical protein
MEWKEEFYNKCEEILQTGHVYKEGFPYKTRWNQRQVGNGIYEGFGVIRPFSQICIHIITSKDTMIFKDVESVYKWLITATG